MTATTRRARCLGAGAVALVCLLAVACATTAPPSRVHPTRLLVRNATAVSCDIYVNRDYLRRVPAGQAVVLRNLPGRPYGVLARCGETRVEKEMQPAPAGVVPDDTPLELLIPGAVPVEDRTGALAIRNDTAFDLEVTVGDVPAGRLFRDSDGVYRDLPVAATDVRFTDIHTGGGWTQPVSLDSATLVPLTVEAPYASLEISNDSQEAVGLAVLGRRQRVESGGKVRLERLPPGTVPIQVTFLDSGRRIELSATLDPGQDEAVKLSDRAGNVVLVNKLSEEAVVALEGETLVTVAAGQTRGVRGLAPGRVELQAVTPSGKVFRQAFVIAPEATQTWYLEANEAQIMVRNLVGERLLIYMDGRKMMAVEPAGAVRFGVQTGPHKLVAETPATGHVEERAINATGGELTELFFGPQPGRLRVENRTAEPLSLYRNGHSLGVLRAGDAVEYSGQPLGRNLIEALNPNRKVVVERHVEVVARDEDIPSIVIADTTVQVEVVNETGEAVMLGPGARSDVRVIPAGGTAVVGVEGVHGVVKFRGETTGNRYDRLVKGKPGEATRLVLDPVTGGIAVNNDAEHALEILLDGESVARLAPGESMVRDRVAPGRHQLQARADGEPFAEVTTRLMADSWYVWRLTEKMGALKVLNRTPEALMLFLGASPAGVLPEGSETLFKDLPPGATTVSAVGTTSRQYHRFTFTARAGEPVSWIIRSAAGGIKLTGLAGRAATLFVDDVEVRQVPAGTAEPIKLALEPGTRIVKALFADGTARAVMVQVTANLTGSVDLEGVHPEVTVRNRTGGAVEVVLDGLNLATVAHGEDFVVLVEQAGKHTLTARTPDGTRRWTLHDVWLRHGASFGWTLSESAP